MKAIDFQSFFAEDDRLLMAMHAFAKAYAELSDENMKDVDRMIQYFFSDEELEWYIKKLEVLAEYMDKEA